MKRFAVCAIVIFVSSNFAFAAGTWQTLDLPGVMWPEPLGVSDGKIVGQSQNGSFIYDGTDFTYLNYLPARETRINGISGNKIVGTYYLESSRHGDDSFIYDGANWTQINYPGVNRTSLLGISGDNLVGQYKSADDVVHNFYYDGSWHSFDNFPEASYTIAAISGGKIIGNYDTTHGFLYDGTNWTTIDNPNALLSSYGTHVSGISGNMIVGDYMDNSGIGYGFLYDGANWTNLDYPAHL